MFANIEAAPNDAIFGLNLAFKADDYPKKLNLGVGAYRTSEGYPYVLPCVTKAEERLLVDDANHEYLTIHGDDDFLNQLKRTLIGETLYEKYNQTICGVQSLSGTGALRLSGEFINKFFPGTCIYLSSPTWGNHKTIFSQAALEIKEYRYYNKNTNGLDLKGMLQDIQEAPNGSAILLHACAHNPTGVDPSHKEWEQIAELIQTKKHIPIFDTAYPGFATGDFDEDTFSIRHFLDKKIPLLITQSCSKNFGLYGERVGALFVSTNSKEEALAVKSQIKLFSRGMYSNPPCHGSNIVKTILSNPELTASWKNDLKIMSGRIIEMRKVLFDALIKNGTPGNWDHIVNQIGMFSFTGLTSPQVDILVKKYHIYLLQNGRISMAGLNHENCKYLADAIHDAVTTVDPKL